MWELFQYATGFDLLNYQLDLSQGVIRPTNEYFTVDRYPSVIVEFVNGVSDGIKPGVVTKIDNYDTVRSWPPVLKVDFFDKRSDPPTCRLLRTGADRFFYVISGGDSLRTTTAAVDEARRTLVFRDEVGQSLNQ